METPIKGKDQILMFRLLQDKDKTNATRLALQTSHTVKKSRKNDTTATKDGTIVANGTQETTIDIEAIASDDLTNDILAYAQNRGLELEVWVVDFSKKLPSGKYMSQYGVGYLSDWEVPAEVDDNTTIKTTLTVSGELVKGEATVSELDQITVKNFFRDTVKGAKNVAPLDETPKYDDKTSSDGGTSNDSKTSTK